VSDITTVEDLRSHYRDPGEPALRKQRPELDHHCADFIAHAPFVAIGTAGPDGWCDVSPKGGPAGFVKVLEDGRVAIPDFSGNNRLDSLTNLVLNPGVGLLFCVPGLDETLRVNGTARPTTDPAVLAAFAGDDVVPKVAIVVEVAEAYLHCGKALRRAHLWDPETWPATDDMAAPGVMIRDHASLPLTDEAAVARLEDSYAATMWKPGGE
jgi:PPOX class probable FMN-dependent enzyme